MLNLQVRRVDDSEAKVILARTIQRIKAMSMIHEKLYQSDDFDAVDIQVYMEDLVHDLQQGFKRENLNFKIECDNIILSLQVAVPMGLIINELVTNAIKYAFAEDNKNQIIHV